MSAPVIAWLDATTITKLSRAALVAGVCRERYLGELLAAVAALIPWPAEDPPPPPTPPARELPPPMPPPRSLRSASIPPPALFQSGHRRSARATDLNLEAHGQGEGKASDEGKESRGGREVIH